MMKIGIFLFVATFLASTRCQNLDELMMATNTANFSSLFDQGMVLDSIKEKCGTEEAFENLKSQPLEFSYCLSKHLNYTTFNSELEESKKIGSMGEVFSKYCSKYPQIRHCFHEMEPHINLCLHPNERSTLKKSLEFAETLKNYMCSDDGNRLAVFVAKGGIECLQMSLENLFQCFNDCSFLIARSRIGDQECKDLGRVRSCVVGSMQSCPESTPANVAESVFKFLRKEFQCNETVEEYLSDYWNFDNNDMYMRVGIIFVTLVLSGILLVLIKTLRVSFINKEY